MRRRLLNVVTAVVLCGCAVCAAFAFGARMDSQSYATSTTRYNGRDSVTLETKGRRVGVKVTWDGNEQPREGWLSKRDASRGRSSDLSGMKFFDYDITVGGYREKAWGWFAAGVEYRRHSIHQPYTGQARWREVYVYVPLWMVSAAFALPPGIWLCRRMLGRGGRRGGRRGFEVAAPGAT